MISATASTPQVDVASLTQSIVTGLIDRYLKDTSTARKLQLGAKRRQLNGWLNTDLMGALPNILPLDVRQPFPFSDNTFDFIYSEHMIEHLTYYAGLYVLRECFRVLKPGGRIRISTPDLHFLFRLCMSPQEPRDRRYIAWAAADIAPVLEPHAEEIKGVVILNNFVRSWGHLFIYDRATMRDALMRANFTSILEPSFNQSDVAELAGLENIARLPSDFLECESMVFEATKAEAGMA